MKINKRYKELLEECYIALLSEIVDNDITNPNSEDLKSIINEIANSFCHPAVKGEKERVKRFLMKVSSKMINNYQIANIETSEA